ncbi:MAG: polyprenyl diphosphate synthase [Dehalococcoidia bacterium]
MTLEVSHAQEPGIDSQPPPPRHVALIMDGNGRWAQRKGQPRLAGHRAGTENIRRILRAFGQCGVRYVTLYAFSTENWGRPQGEVTGLLEILQTVIQEEVQALHAENVRLRHLGMLERLPPDLVDSIRAATDLTKENTGLNLTVAFDYGGRAEIVQAVRAIVASGVAASEITEDLLAGYLYLPDVPDPDLIIRTAGEQRLSNFLIWQAAYSEYYQTPALWPDFDDKEVERALEEYARRKRRFGRLPDVP